ncbi:MAG: OmpW family outer membrane protein [Burkholderiales bacterium]
MSSKLLRPVAVAVLAALAAAPMAAQAQNWVIGARALYVSPNVSTSISGLDVDSAWWAEVDLTYYFTKNIAVELIAAANKHTVTLNGADLGSVGVLPPTLTVQYHWNDLGAFQPYVGAGINYTYFYDNELANNTLHIKDSSWGGALQVGADYEIAKNWYLNADIKYVWMSTDVYVNSTGANLGSLDINPWIFGVGVRYRF